MSIALPAVDFQVSYPRIVRSISISRAGERAVAFTEYADEFWTVEMRTRPLRPSQRVVVEAFADAARDGLATIVYTPKHMCIPRAYWGDANNSALSNTGAVSAITNVRQFTVNSVDNGLTLQAGDLIGLESGDYRAICRVQVGGMASGNSLSLTVEPPLPSYIGVTSLVRFKNPVLNTRMVPGSFSIPDEPRPVASFTLVEVPK